MQGDYIKGRREDGNEPGAVEQRTRCGSGD